MSLIQYNKINAFVSVIISFPIASYCMLTSVADNGYLLTLKLEQIYACVFNLIIIFWVIVLQHIFIKPYIKPEYLRKLMKQVEYIVWFCLNM